VFAKKSEGGVRPAEKKSALFEEQGEGTTEWTGGKGEGILNLPWRIRQHLGKRSQKFLPFMGEENNQKRGRERGQKKPVKRGDIREKKKNAQSEKKPGVNSNMEGGGSNQQGAAPGAGRNGNDLKNGGGS